MEIEKSALLVIDMQEDYIGEKSKYGYDSQILIDSINTRLDAAGLNSEMVIYIKNTRVLKSGRHNSELVKGLSIISDLMIDKEKASVFDNNELLKLLRMHDITKIETVGIDGNCCVASSAIDAAKLGFSVVYPLKYIGIKNKRLFGKTMERLKKANVEIVES